MNAPVLMVCTGNICRSPIAQALLERALPGIAADSAGTHALVGRAADPLGVQLMDERGIDLRAHVATALTDNRIDGAGLILTMTQAQSVWLKGTWPAAAGKVHRLGVHGDFDVVDPYRRTRFTFELAVSQIEQGLSNWIGAIRLLTGS
jgi:protein-tyrosine phosphatase